MLEESDHAYERSGDAERRYLVQDAERPDGMQRRRRVSHLDRTALYEHECSTQSGETRFRPHRGYRRGPARTAPRGAPSDAQHTQGEQIP
jgi:hypothetical protein